VKYCEVDLRKFMPVRLKHYIRVPRNMKNLELSGNFVNLEKSGNRYGQGNFFMTSYFSRLAD